MWPLFLIPFALCFDAQAQCGYSTRSVTLLDEPKPLIDPMISGASCMPL